LPRLAPAIDPLWRLHGEAGPLLKKGANPGIYRFDAPAGQYPVTYANQDRLGVFGERFGDTGWIKNADRGIRLSRLTPRRPLRLLPLDLAPTQRAFGIDARVCVSRRYDATQRWGFAFHQWYPEADGIRYTARLAGPHLNLCLFLDRCAGDLEVLTIGALASLPMDVLRAGADYDLAIEWFLPAR
jgi:hypothetical protein